MDRQHASIPQEKWLPIVGYEGHYEASNHGRVRIVKDRPRTFVGQVLKPNVNGRSGYLYAHLNKDGVRKLVSIHRLVAAAFIGACPEGKEVNHKDGIKSNNQPYNLEYLTRSDNHFHAYRNGLKVSLGLKGVTNGRTVLTESDVFSVRSRLGAETQVEIAKSLNIAQTTVSAIATRKNWGWL